jgi:hypothetical protein
MGGIEAGGSVKRDVDGTVSRDNPSPFLLIALLFFTETLPLSFWYKKPLPFFVYGKGEFIQFSFI